jgi:hypothetical protein
MIDSEGKEKDVEDDGYIGDGGRGLGEDAEEDDEGTSSEVDDGVFGNKKFGDDILPKLPIGIRRGMTQILLGLSSGYGSWTWTYNGLVSYLYSM